MFGGVKFVLMQGVAMKDATGRWLGVVDKENATALLALAASVWVRAWPQTAARGIVEPCLALLRFGPSLSHKNE